jgi:hypothetical protein
VSLYEEDPSSNEMGAVAVQIPTRDGNLARARIPLDFVQQDPSLADTLDAIAMTYQEVKRAA